MDQRQYKYLAAKHKASMQLTFLIKKKKIIIIFE